MTHRAQTFFRGGPVIRWLMVAASLVSFIALDGCSNWHLGGHSPSLPAQTDAIERSRMQLAKPPKAAGECIVDNARIAGVHAELVPLYGLESIGVTVTTRVAGDHIAVFSLTSGDGGTRAETTTWSGLADRPDLLRKLTQGC